MPDGVNEIFQEFVNEDIEATVWVNNPNDGKIWGLEFDFSSPVTFIDPNLHVFANYTWIDSEIRDANENFPIDRRFSLQPEYIYNVGFDHLLESIAFTWGASYQKLGPAEEWVNVSAEAKEVTDVEYGGNLEFFVEKTIADKFVVRLAAQNLLDRDKDEQHRDLRVSRTAAGGHAGHLRPPDRGIGPGLHPDLPRHVLAPNVGQRLHAATAVPLAPRFR